MQNHTNTELLAEMENHKKSGTQNIYCQKEDIKEVKSNTKLSLCSLVYRC